MNSKIVIFINVLFLLICQFNCGMELTKQTFVEKIPRNSSITFGEQGIITYNKYQENNEKVYGRILFADIGLKDKELITLKNQEGIFVYNMQGEKLFSSSFFNNSYYGGSCISIHPIYSNYLITNNLSENVNRSIQFHCLKRLKSFIIPCETNKIIIKPVMGVHPNGKELTYKSKWDEITICELPRFDSCHLILYLLNPKDETQFDMLPKELKEMILDIYINKNKSLCVIKKIKIGGLFPYYGDCSFIKYSPNGKYIARISPLQIILYNRETQELKKLYEEDLLEKRYKQIASAIFHPKNNIIVILDNDGRLSYYDIDVARHVGLQVKVGYIKCNDDNSEMTDRLVFSSDDKLFIADQGSIVRVDIPQEIFNPIHFQGLEKEKKTNKLLEYLKNNKFIGALTIGISGALSTWLLYYICSATKFTK